jgi:hypothetical protein
MNLRNTDRNGKDIPVTVYLNGKDGKVFYSIGLYRKIGEKSEYGYINAKFDKDIVLSNKDRIILKEASLDFYKKGKETIPQIRVWKFEKVENNVENNDNDFITIDNTEELPF